MTNYLQLFKKREQYWFDKLKPFLFNGDADVLKIGNGFGYLTEMIRPFSNSLQVFEIAVYADTINKKSITLYDGKNLLLDEKSVDVAIFNLSLHHIPKNIEYLKNVISITKKRVILVEETYDNIFQKIHLIWRDWYVNMKADQPCKVFWGSYLQRNKVEKIFNEIGLNIIHREAVRHHSYYKELIVLDIV